MRCEKYFIELKRTASRTAPVTQQTSGLAMSVSINPGPTSQQGIPKQHEQLSFFLNLSPHVLRLLFKSQNMLMKLFQKMFRSAVWSAIRDVISSSLLLPYLSYSLPILHLCIF